MELIKELLTLVEAPDAQLQQLRDQLHALSDQADDIESAGGEVPESMKQKLNQLRSQIDAKKKQLGMAKATA